VNPIVGYSSAGALTAWTFWYARRRVRAARRGRLARDYRLREALATLGGDFALQGEVHGEGIQGNHLAVKGKRLSVFNLFNIETHAYAGHSALAEFCKAHAIRVL